MDFNHKTNLVLENTDTKHKISVDEWSNTQPASKLIVFIHGAGGRSNQFEGVCNYLNELHSDWCLVCFDNVGHGNSFSKEQEYNASDFNFESLYSNAKFVIDFFLNKFKQSQNQIELIIAGHSVGSAIAMKYAIENKDCVSRLILLGTKEVAPHNFIWYLPSFALEWIRPLFSNSFRKLSFHSSTSEKLIDEEAERNKNNTMFMMQSIILNLKWPSRQEISSITVPTLVIAGETDGITTPEQGKEVHKLIKDSKYKIIDQTSHCMMLEKENEVGKVIEDFVNC